MKERITITIDRILLEWLEQQIKEKRFANKSHALEFLITKKIKEGKL